MGIFDVMHEGKGCWRFSAMVHGKEYASRMWVDAATPVEAVIGIIINSLNRLRSAAGISLVSACEKKAEQERVAKILLAPQ